MRGVGGLEAGSIDAAVVPGGGVAGGESAFSW